MWSWHVNNAVCGSRLSMKRHAEVACAWLRTCCSCWSAAYMYVGTGNMLQMLAQSAQALGGHFLNQTHWRVLNRRLARPIYNLQGSPYYTYIFARDSS